MCQNIFVSIISVNYLVLQKNNSIIEPHFIHSNKLRFSLHFGHCVEQIMSVFMLEQIMSVFMHYFKIQIHQRFCGRYKCYLSKPVHFASERGIRYSKYF